MANGKCNVGRERVKSLDVGFGWTAETALGSEFQMTVSCGRGGKLGLCGVLAGLRNEAKTFQLRDMQIG